MSSMRAVALLAHSPYVHSSGYIRDAQWEQYLFKEGEGDNDGGKSKEMNDYRAVQNLFS